MVKKVNSSQEDVQSVPKDSLICTLLMDLWNTDKSFIYFCLFSHTGVSAVMRQMYSGKRLPSSDIALNTHANKYQDLLGINRVKGR